MQSRLDLYFYELFCCNDFVSSIFVRTLWSLLGQENRNVFILKDKDKLLLAVQHALDAGIEEDDPVMVQALDSMIGTPSKVATEQRAEAKYKVTPARSRVQQDLRDEVATANERPPTNAPPTVHSSCARQPIPSTRYSHLCIHR